MSESYALLLRLITNNDHTQQRPMSVEIKNDRNQIRYYTYTQWSDARHEQKCDIEFALEAMNKYGWIFTINDAPLEAQQNKEYRRAFIVKGFQQRHYNHLTRVMEREQRIFCDADYKELPDEWKLDYEVAWAALEHKRAEWKDIPKQLTTCDNFLRWLCIKDASYFNRMPDHIRGNLEYWRSQETAYSPKLACFLLEAHPALREDCNFWLNNIDYRQESDVGVMLHGMAAPNILQHRQVMLNMCTYFPTPFFSKIKQPFCDDEDFIKTVMQDMHTKDLGDCSLQVLVKFPGAIIPRYALEHPLALRRLARNSTGDMLENEEFVKAWFTSGGLFLEDCFPDEWRSRRDIFLWIAKYCTRKFGERQNSFSCASPRLYSDKSFMMEVIECDPELYRYASSELKQDMDVRTLVCSKCANVENIQQCGMSYGNAIRTLKVAKRKYEADTGFREFCHCMEQSFPELAVSSSDPDSGAEWNALVAEYLGAQRSEESQRVRKCAKLFRIVEPYV